MNFRVRLFLAVLFVALMAAPAAWAVTAANPWQSWVEQALKQDPARQKELIMQYEGLLRLEIGHDFSEQGLLNLLQLNLDQSPESELLALIGRVDAEVDLAVFKQGSQGWELVDRVAVYTWYYPPELGVLSTGRQPVFYVRQLEQRGTGIYQESYELYKLLENRLLHVLHLPLEARIYGWGLALNQDISARMQGLASPDDVITVNYRYHYFAGPGAGELEWDSHRESTCLQAEEQVDFYWNAAKLRYEPSFAPDDKSGPLRLQSFESLGDAKLFAKAFAQELIQSKKNASVQDQLCLKQLPQS